MRLSLVKKTIVFMTVLSLIVIMVSGCQTKTVKNEEPVTKTKLAFDTICSITTYGNSDQVFDQCFNKITEIEKKMSVDLVDSEVSEINQNAGINPVVVSDDTYQVISAGKKYSEMTLGNFDITVGPLVRLWGINKPDQKIPSEEEVRTTLQKINYNNVVLNDAERSVFLTEKGMSLDLGGIAKGYAGDAIAEIMKKNGVEHAIIDLGGNLVVIGSKPDGTDWGVGIQTPFKPNGEYFAVLHVYDKAIVTSGIYQRYFEENGKIYHHIMDTHTGYPVNNGLVSVTIICKKSMDADALAKAFTMGLDKGIQLIENKKDADAIFVTDQKEVYITQGLKGLLKITDDQYKLVER